MRIVTLAAAGLILCMAALAHGTLCADCRKGGPWTKDIGKCSQCAEGRTTSGQFKLCWQCSTRLNQCEHCLKALPAATQPAAQPIDTTKDGVHRSGKWEYRYTISNAGTRSEGYHGALLFDGKPVAEPAKINDYYVTPWGNLYWVGQPALLFGGHGWMPKPKVSVPAGNALPSPG